MRQFSITGTKPVQWALGLTMLATLAACGGGDSAAPIVSTPVSSANVVLVSSASNAATVTPAFIAVATKPITFANGFAGTDATGAAVSAPAGTTVAFSTGTATSPVATFTSSGLTATATTTFGSCLFTFAANSRHPATHPFGPGKTFKVDPCSITIPTANTKADGNTQIMDISMTFGGYTITYGYPVVVDSSGAVTIGGTKVATVTVVNTTGASN
jgi:hypothetical protein